MPLQSDLTIDASKLDPRNIPEKTRAFNDHLMSIGKKVPKWWEVGIVNFRRMREAGETPLPGLTLEPTAQPLSLPSREGASSRKIPCRLFKPKDPSIKPRSLFYHIHGGGWVTGSEYGQDPLLQSYADGAQILVLSVGYRLAPEHPYPAGFEDCADVGEWLVDNAEKEFGVGMGFVGGESAGGNLSAGVVFHLLDKRPEFGFKGVVLAYGAFDNTRDQLPQVYQFDLPLVLTWEIIEKYFDAYLANVPPEKRRDIFVSPLYAELAKMKLPPAIFPCGTLDPLLDDSIVMSTKWALTGVESILKLYPGAPHGFTLFNPDLEMIKEAVGDIITFVHDKLEATV